MPQSEEDLFSSSVVVTGTHYSMSTLVGQILGHAPEFNVVHEPLNPEPTLGYNAVGADRWYQYYDEDHYPELREKLSGFLTGRHVLGQTLSRTARIRSRHDFLRVGKYAKTNLGFRLRPKRAVFKDPFLAFSGHLLQKHDGLPVVLCLRHPCAFAESLKRRGKGFDFTDLAEQPALMAMMPEIADRVALFARGGQPVLDQGALLWKTVYGFAAAHYLPHPRTCFICQEDLANDPIAEVDRVLTRLDATRTSAVDDFLEASLKARTSADFAQDGSSYVHRNAKETAQKWRRRLTDTEIARVMDIIGDTGRAFGYDEA